MKKIFILLLLSAFFLPWGVNAQETELIQDQTNILKAQVLEIVDQDVREVPWMEINADHQTLKVKILEKDRAGEILTVENDYLKLKTGEKFYLLETIDGETGNVTHYVQDKDRMPVIIILSVLFVILVLIFGGIQGIRGLASLIGSMLLILFIMMPGILSGYSPILISVGVSSLIIILGSYVTHGFNKTTSSAVLGMIATIIFTGVLAFISVNAAQLTGLESEEAVYLNLNTRGTIDLVGLLFGGIMIGLLGVLYDVAIGQAVSVEELRDAAPHLDRKTIFKRVVRIGREHIGALVNTLAIAYVGASLPLLLLFYGNNTESLSYILSREIFSVEIIRIMIGSIGLVLAVPITTLISVLILVKKENNESGQN